MLTAIGIVLLVLKLIGTLQVSWWVVAAPFMANILLTFVLILLAIVAEAMQ